MILQIPNIVISPTIDTMQAYFAKITKSVLTTVRSVPLWGAGYATTDNATSKYETKGNNQHWNYQFGSDWR